VRFAPDGAVYVLLLKQSSASWSRMFSCVYVVTSGSLKGKSLYYYSSNCTAR